jgi:two-component system OmpR family response regulator
MSDQIPIIPPNDDTGADPEATMRDARLRFIAAFPKRADSIGFLLNMVVTVGPKGPVAPLVEIVHRTAGLAGTLGFPTVSAHARALEELLDGAELAPIDGRRANAVFDALRDSFSEDLAKPPSWALTAAKAAAPRRIMVVEDDEDQREVVSIHLQSAGYVVVPVADGSSVLDVARKHRPDLVLLDANLPGLDGYSVCRLLKADPDLANIPVIFTTVRAKVDDKAVGLLLGADEYLTKPLDLGELAIRISVLLDRRAQRVPPSAANTVAGEDPSDLDYESFVVVAREQIAVSPAVLAMIRVPEVRLMETFGALRAELRRRDVVACFDANNLVLLMVDMAPSRARDRLTEIVTMLGGSTPPPFTVGLAYSHAPGAKAFEALLGEADEAIAYARHRGLVAAVAGDATTAAEPAAAARGPALLVADDPDVVRLVEGQLRAAGYDPVVASEVGQAVQAADARKPEVVIVDLAAPRVAGFDVLSRLHRQPGGARVIVLAGRGREQDVTRAFALGADDYVTKPFSPQELLARIARLQR